MNADEVVRDLLLVALERSKMRGQSFLCYLIEMALLEVTRPQQQTTLPPRAPG
jgi:hypothetical protein